MGWKSEVRCRKACPYGPAEFVVIENGETLRLIKEEMQAMFQAHFAEAERLVKETGYHRWDVEIEEIRQLSYEF